MSKVEQNENNGSFYWLSVPIRLQDGNQTGNVHPFWDFLKLNALKLIYHNLFFFSIWTFLCTA